MYVTMHGKLSDPHFDVSLFSNPGEKASRESQKAAQRTLSFRVLSQFEFFLFGHNLSLSYFEFHHDLSFVKI